MPSDAGEAVQSVWWLRHGWLLLGGLALLAVASLSTRRWGGRLFWGMFLPTVGGSFPSERRRSYHTFALVAARYISNTSLLAGTIAVAVILVAACWPSALSPYDPDERGRRLQEIDGRITAAPFPPSAPYPLGSDLEGRDMLSRILHGTRATMALALSVALMRLGIGAALGFAAGWRGGAASQQILSLAAVSSSVPSLLFAFVFILAIGPHIGFGVFLLGLGLTGWAELTNVIHSAVRTARAQPYMEGAVALGSSTVHLARKHLVPAVLPQLLPAIALEISAVMLMLGELGFLGVLLGERYVEISIQMERASVRMPATPEWSALLSGARLAIFRWPWLSMGPALAFLFAILGFNLLAIGLRAWFDPYRARLWGKR